ncbi:darcynin family protein [Roseateles oligotrophus]|uniref:Darcynin 1 n=1 Tax=Roseateles oligotrophus TaxID=1769250 RepID=A0ABT2YCV1_9BURK|nr:darcynin family protein [Roseateles oligotrophus]MCV2367854.1 hypothetical protein [Roseateles oligotrophus]
MNTCFMLVNALPAWLRLSRGQRAEVFAQEVLSLLPQHPGIQMRHFDAEAYSAVCSDVLMLQVPDTKALHFFIEGLRDSAIYTTPYFEIVHIIPTWEDGYRAYEEAQGLAL